MRTALLACVPWLLACRGLNPAFQDDGSDTAIVDDDSTTSTSGTTGSRDAADGSGNTSFTSGGSDPTSTQGPPETSSGIYETEGPPELKPFHVPIVFVGRPELHENFVARVQIQLDQLVDVPRQRIGFFDRTSDHPAPFDVIAYSPEEGYLDAWVLLEQWLPQVDTIVDLEVGPIAPESENPWHGFEHVWYLDDPDVPDDVASEAGGEFIGYEDDDGVAMGVIRRARSFDGSGQHASLQTSINALSNSADFAVSAWIYIAELPTGPAPLLGRRGSLIEGGPLRIEWAIMIDNSGRVALRFAGPGNALTYVEGTTPSLDQWHHYAFVVMGDSSFLTIDGQRFAESNTTPMANLFSSTLRLGGSFDDNANSPAFEGTIDHVMWFNERIPEGWVETVIENHPIPSLGYKLDGVIFD